MLKEVTRLPICAKLLNDRAGRKFQDPWILDPVFFPLNSIDYWHLRSNSNSCPVCIEHSSLIEHSQKSCEKEEYKFYSYFMNWPRAREEKTDFTSDSLPKPCPP